MVNPPARLRSFRKLAWRRDRELLLANLRARFLVPDRCEHEGGQHHDQREEQPNVQPAENERHSNNGCHRQEPSQDQPVFGKGAPSRSPPHHWMDIERENQGPANEPLGEHCIHGHEPHQDLHRDQSAEVDSHGLNPHLTRGESTGHTPFCAASRLRQRRAVVVLGRSNPKGKAGVLAGTAPRSRHNRDEPRRSRPANLRNVDENSVIDNVPHVGASGLLGRRRFARSQEDSEPGPNGKSVIDEERRNHNRSLRVGSSDHEGDNPLPAPGRFTDTE